MRPSVKALTASALALFVGSGATLAVAAAQGAPDRPSDATAATVPAVKRTSNEHGTGAPITAEVDAAHPAVAARAATRRKSSGRDRGASKPPVPVNDASAKTEMARPDR